MDQDKRLIIHFNNGTQMKVSFPTQIKSSLGALVEVSKRILEADKLVIHTKERLLIIPWSSVKYVDASAIPETGLPIGTIKGARVEE